MSSFPCWHLLGAIRRVNGRPVWTKASFVRGDLPMFLWGPAASTRSSCHTRVARQAPEFIPCMCLCPCTCTASPSVYCDHQLPVVPPTAPAPAHEYSHELKMLIIILCWLSRAAVRPHLLAVPFRPDSLPHQLEFKKCPPPANHQYLWTDQGDYLL